MNTFAAKYAGPCAECPEGITPGDEVVYTEDAQLAHAHCNPYADALTIAPTETLCAECFMVHRGDCL